VCPRIRAEIFGGCCGTDQRYIEALAKEVHFQREGIVQPAARADGRALGHENAAAQGGS
jgi:hypothetical protein